MSPHGKTTKAKPTDVNLRLTENARSLPSDVQNLYLTSQKTDANGQALLIPLSSVAHLEAKSGGIAD